MKILDQVKASRTHKDDSKTERPKVLKQIREKNLSEAPLVTRTTHALDIILDKLKDDLYKDLEKGNTRNANEIAKLVNYHIDKEKQQKGRVYLSKRKK